MNSEGIEDVKTRGYIDYMLKISSLQLSWFREWN